MNIHRMGRTALLLAAALTSSAAAQAAEIKILCSTALRGVMEELGPQFEHATGHTLAIQYDTSVGMKDRIDRGESFDLTVLTPALIDDLIAHGKVVAGTRTSIAKVGMAIAVRAGARKPDIATTAAVKRTLLDAQSITYAKEGAAGLYFADLIKRLGMAEALASKTTLGSSGAQVGQTVATGAAEIGVLPISEILATKGVEMVGPFPADIQGYAVMVGGQSSASANAAPVKSLLEFLTAPAALPVIRKKGMERG